MRARDIKPGFFKNDQLADCSMAARLLFPGLWMMADREGRLENRPKKSRGRYSRSMMWTLPLFSPNWNGLG